MFHVTFSTLLYLRIGDLQVTKQSTLLFGIVYIYCAVLIFAIAFNNCVEDYIFATGRRKLRTTLQQMSTERFQADWLRDALQPLPFKSSAGNGYGSKKAHALDSLPSEREEPIGSVDDDTPIPRAHDSLLTYSYEAVINPLAPTKEATKKLNGDVIQGVCGEDRFVLLTLIELGVLDKERDVQPLRQVIHPLYGTSLILLFLFMSSQKFKEMDVGGRGYVDQQVYISHSSLVCNLHLPQ